MVTLNMGALYALCNALTSNNKNIFFDSVLHCTYDTLLGYRVLGSTLHFIFANTVTKVTKDKKHRAYKEYYKIASEYRQRIFYICDYYKPSHVLFIGSDQAGAVAAVANLNLLKDIHGVYTALFRFGDKEPGEYMFDRHARLNERHYSRNICTQWWSKYAPEYAFKRALIEKYIHLPNWTGQ